MNLNGVIAFILLYFTEFDSFAGLLLYATVIEDRPILSGEYHQTSNTNLWTILYIAYCLFLISLYFCLSSCLLYFCIYVFLMLPFW